MLVENVLVTGGSGFIGSHLAARLLDEGRRVVCVDNFDDYYDAAIKEANIEPLLRNPRFKLVRLDIRRPRRLLSLMRDEAVDVVAHLAARPGVRRSLKEPSRYMQINVQGTVNVLEACRRAGVRHVVFGSSSSVYGHCAATRLSESTDPGRPASPYGLSKMMGELLCETFYRSYGLHTTALRFFTVYGPAQRPDMAISRFVRFVDKGEEVPLYGNGTLRRDFTYVSDIVNGIEAAIDKRLPGFVAINLGAGRSIVVKRVLEQVEQGLGKKASVRLLPQQPGDVESTLADISRARAILGYEPRVPIKTGVQSYIDWYRQTRGRGRPGSATRAA